MGCIMRTSVLPRVVVVCAFFAAAWPVASSAQSSSSQAGADKLGLEEIVVTATRRTESAQDVALAISALNAEDIAVNKINSVGDLIGRIPSFAINSFSKQRLIPALRAASANNPTPGGDQSVALFIDDVYYGGSADWQPDLFDVERIEVLRGPQGTLFGRNVVGGALNIITSAPTAEKTAKVAVSVGTDDLLDFDALISGALSERVHAQLVVSSRTDDGRTRNVFLGEDVDSTDRKAARLKLRIMPSDALIWDLSLSYNRDHSGGAARDFVAGRSGFQPFNTAGWEQYLTPQEFAAMTSFRPDRDEDTSHSCCRGNTVRSNSMTAINRLQYDATWGSLISITGYRDREEVLDPTDVLGVPAPILVAGYPTDFSQLSQEVRFVSPSERRLRYVAGLYYLDINQFENEAFSYYLLPNTFFGFLQSVVFGLPLGRFQPERIMDINTESYAAYVQGDFDITSSLTLTVGARYTRDEKSGYSQVLDRTGRTNFIFPNYPRTVLQGEWSETTPRIALSYKIRPDVMVYTSYSEGFKSGAFNFASTSALSALPFDPEFVESFEAGIKSQFWNDRAQLNATYFHARYDGAQNAFVTPQGVPVVVNVDDTKVDGVEMDLEARLFAPLSVFVNYAYTKGEIAGGEFDGNDPAMTPENAFTLGTVMTIPVAHGEWSLRADYQYKSEYFLEVSNEPAFATGNKGLVNANLTYSNTDRDWRVTLWGKNITNERFVTYGQDLVGFLYPGSPNPQNLPATMPRYNSPASFGLTVTYLVK